MKTVVALPGEGIGPEVVDATCELLLGTGLPLKILTPPQGAAAVKSHGETLPEETKRAAIAADGVLFCAAGPTTSPVVTWLRWEMSAWAGLRPIKFYPGMHSPLADPVGIDYVIIRVNSEGLYPGREGDLADLARLMPDLLVRILPRDLRQRRPRMPLLATRFTPALTTQRLRRRLGQPIRRRWLRRIPRIGPQPPLQLSNLSTKLTDQRVLLRIPRHQLHDQRGKLAIR